VAVGVSVGVLVLVGVAVGVSVGVLVLVGVAVGVSVGVLVLVGVAVGGNGMHVPCTLRKADENVAEL
jgi:hypothetical protein